MKSFSLLIRLTWMLLLFVSVSLVTTNESQATNKDVFDLVFKGFVVQTNGASNLSEIQGQLPRDLQTEDWSLEVLDEEDSVYQLIPDEIYYNETSWGKSKIWNLTYRMKGQESDFFRQFDPYFEPREIIQKNDKGDSYGSGGDSVPGSDGLLGGCSWPEEDRSDYMFRGKKYCYPKSSDDFDWANKVMRFKEAREHTNNKMGDGILIGHPDSGYTHHPEISSNFLMDRSINYVEDDAVDGADNYKGPHHGHGTSTGSLISSQDGMQNYEFTEWHRETYGDNPEDAPYVEGIAPNSMIISYRVMKGNVIRFGFKNLTKAIKQAVKDGVGVVSISLGGPLPMPWLHRAIKKAQRAGIIIIAASGNYIPGGVLNKFVVWPAAYKETVAVAASDSNNEVWKHSSRGKRIDITVPGAATWVARAKYNKELGRRVTEVGRGSGTSFSTAYAAGAAALWLSHHGHESLKAEYGSENIVWLFKYMLENHAYNRPDGWDTKRYGPGILDVYKLITAPLPDPSIFKKNKLAEDEFKSEKLEQFKDLFDVELREKIEDGLKTVLKIESSEELHEKFDRLGLEMNMLFTGNEKMISRLSKIADSKGFRKRMRARRMRKKLRKAGLSDYVLKEFNLK